jgi:hypothetical protein
MCLNLRVDRRLRLAEKSPGWRVVGEDDMMRVVMRCMSAMQAVEKKMCMNRTIT